MQLASCGQLTYSCVAWNPHQLPSSVRAVGSASSAGMLHRVVACGRSFWADLTLSEVSGSLGDLGTFLPLVVSGGLRGGRLLLVVASGRSPGRALFLFRHASGCLSSPATSWGRASHLHDSVGLVVLSRSLSDRVCAGSILDGLVLPGGSCFMVWCCRAFLGGTPSALK